jgi:hypothetical protein
MACENNVSGKSHRGRGQSFRHYRNTRAIKCLTRRQHGHSAASCSARYRLFWSRTPPNTAIARSNLLAAAEIGRIAIASPERA